LSDDGRHGITLIAFIGSVFSPYYALARRRGKGDPENHVALNVALYGAGGKRWALTERGRDALQRDAHHFHIGPSSLDWDGTTLTISIREVTTPLPGRIRGVVRVHPAALVEEAFSLDGAGEHTWRPIAPVSRVEVDLDHPHLSWSGKGYFDWNSGSVPLEQSFARWDWSRASTADGTTILYDVNERDGGSRSLAVRIGATGEVTHIPAPPRVTLAPTRIWRIARGTRNDAAAPAPHVETLEDTPFYARSLVMAQIDGVPAHAMHESLSLDRFRTPIVQMMLPFRMPRRTF
jgi:carotenoid 1,2-hydratase